MPKVSDKPAEDFISMVGEREQEFQQRISKLERALAEDRERLAALVLMGEREYVLLQSEIKFSREHWLDVSLQNIDEFISIRPVNCPPHPLLTKENID